MVRNNDYTTHPPAVVNGLFSYCRGNQLHTHRCHSTRRGSMPRPTVRTVTCQMIEAASSSSSTGRRLTRRWNPRFTLRACETWVTVCTELKSLRPIRGKLGALFLKTTCIVTSWWLPSIRRDSTSRSWLRLGVRRRWTVWSIRSS